MAPTRLNRSMLKPLLFSGVASLAILCAPAAANTTASEAQASGEETGEVSTAANTRRTFTPEDFVRFAPRSALDMARQIPGFSIRQGDGARGLGAADTNVLINGRRISGKSNGPVAALQRIPTEEVVRLELVDGASLDIGGLSGQVLNVITASGGGVSGQFRYAPQARTRGTPARLLEGRVAIAGSGRKDEWTLSLENNSDRRGDDGPERVFNGAGELIEVREEFRNDNTERPNLSGSYTRVADNGNVLNLTGQLAGFIRKETETSERFVVLPSGDLLLDNTRFFESTEDEYNFEIGADYEFVVGEGRLKLIGYHRYEDSPTRSEQLTQFAADRSDAGSVFTRDADEGETIARAEYSFGGLGGDLLLALEGVRNFLEIDSALEVRDNTGAFQPVALPGATARVEEDRADLGLTYSRALAPNLQFQTSGGAEYSRISQSGPFGQTRTFYRPKGFVALDWKANSSFNLSGRIERVVGQLSFFDFIASVDLDQDRADVTNADLKPQQSWVFEVEAAIGLGKLGSLRFSPFYEDIIDIVDQIPIEGGGQAPGNLPSAQIYGFESDLTLLSEGLGWRGTRLDFSLSLVDSSIIDPLLGFTRDISGIDTTRINSNIRHDVQGSSWAMGGSVNWADFAPNKRLDEIFEIGESFAFASVFVENKNVAGLTVRANVNNVLNRQNLLDRTVFIDRSAGLIDFVEDRDRTFGTIFTLEIEGSF